MSTDLREVQKPLKEKYRNEPGSSRLTLDAKASEKGTPIACSVNMGGHSYEAEAHAGAGGSGNAACSGDLLLRSLRRSKRTGCAREGRRCWLIGPPALRRQLFLYPDGKPGPEYTLQVLPERYERASHEAVEPQRYEGVSTFDISRLRPEL
jgi:hypothetical protein